MPPNDEVQNKAWGIVSPAPSRVTKYDSGAGDLRASIQLLPLQVRMKY